MSGYPAVAKLDLTPLQNTAKKVESILELIGTHWAWWDSCWCFKEHIAYFVPVNGLALLKNNLNDNN